MSLRIYNTLTRTKETFVPLDPKHVRMYVCGPTVYDFAHIGNARPAIVFDVLYRLLRHIYGPEHVTYVRNITDVDDKINARALRDYPGVPLNDAIRKVTETTYDQYQKDVTALGCLPPTAQPRATEHIKGMVEMIQRLLDLNFAYVAEGEDGRETLFDVKAMPDYGKLSRRAIDEQKAGARIAVERHKRNPEDFVLWKESRSTEPGWHATFVVSAENQSALRLNSNTVSIYGRPGWHIECSVMSKAHLGEVFDIHGGGLDLIFPHHENEIAQSRCAHGTPVMANYWMHNGFLQVEGQKMSKSLGNFYTIQQLLSSTDFGGRTWGKEVLRLAMLKTHYRQPIDWTVQSLMEAQAEFRSYAEIVREYVSAPAIDDDLVESLTDDLNTSDAITRLRALRDQAKKGNIQSGRRLLGSLRLLGFFTDNYHLKNTVSGYTDEVSFLSLALRKVARDYPISNLIEQAQKKFSGPHTPIYDALAHFTPGTVVADVSSLHTHFDKLLEFDRARLAARAAKDWKESDRIRDELAAMGIAIKDNKDGTTSWEVKR